MNKIKSIFSKFIQAIKKKWLISNTKTLMLFAIIIALFVLINYGMQALDITPIDLTSEKLYSLTDESKEKVKNIDKEVKIYLIGYTEDSTLYDLAKQYSKVNNKITAEAVNVTERADIAQKYGIESGNTGIIIESGDKNKILTEDDLYTYDTTTYESVNVSEEKLTSTIKMITSDDIPKAYFLSGYSDFSLNTNMTYLGIYTANEVMEIDTLDLLVSGKVPDDCDTLVITTPNKDFDEVTTNAIIDYINSGRNILWFNGCKATASELPNIQKILDLYGVNKFETGIIKETDSSKIVLNAPEIIKPTLGYSKITKDIESAGGVILVNATKINVKESADLENLKVEKTDLITTSDSAYFRKDLSNNSDEKTDSDEAGEFVIGAEFVKTLQKPEEKDMENSEELKSTLVLYGENFFVSDYTISETNQIPCVTLYGNKDIAINSMEYLMDREEDIVARKSTGTVTYTATEQQDKIIRIIIFSVPIVIIIAGIIVWQVRRRKK